MNKEDFIYYEKNNNTTLFETLKSNAIVKQIQNYIPIYSKFFQFNETNWNSINLNHTHQIQNIVLDSSSSIGYDNMSQFNIETRSKKDTTTKKKKSFFKFSPLIDPVKYLTNKYTIDNSNAIQSIQYLPDYKSIQKISNNCIEEKMNTSYNVSYIDGFFCFLSNKLYENHTIHHCIQYYGSFLCIKNYFKYDICDDIEQLFEGESFMEHNNSLFYIDTQHVHKIGLFNQSLKNKPKLNIKSVCKKNSTLHNIDEDMELIVNIFETNNDSLIHDSKDSDIEYVDSIQDECNGYFSIGRNGGKGHDKGVCKDDDTDLSGNNAENADNSSDDENSEASYTTDEDCEGDESDSCSESGDESDGDEKESKDNSETDSIVDSNISISTGDDNNDETEEINIFIKDFPVEIICLEQLEHTLDYYIENTEIEQDEWIAILAQVIMNLIIYNKCFDFTHNDLHTNNIMFVSTQKQHLYYTFNGKHYKIPTYGKIWKIIDFGRSIYTFKGQHIYSDSYFKHGDAHSQYNFGVFYDSTKPTITPNKAFDLSRLGCSLFDYFIDSMDELEDEDVKKDALIQLIIQWCTDDKGMNILYKSNGRERYPGFKLYKMITRNIHHCIPSNEIEKPIFQDFIVSKKTIHKRLHILNIDTLPDYTKK